MPENDKLPPALGGVLSDDNPFRVTGEPLSLDLDPDGGGLAGALALSEEEALIVRIVVSLKAASPQAYLRAQEAVGGERVLMAEVKAFVGLCGFKVLGPLLGSKRRQERSLVRAALLEGAVRFKVNAPSGDLRDYWASQVWLFKTINQGNRRELLRAFVRDHKQAQARKKGGREGAKAKANAVIPFRDRARVEYSQAKASNPRVTKVAWAKRHAHEFGRSSETVRKWLEGL
jgi:hypothetical protein